ncbi:MAG: ABC transporter substrate-binding protein [Christensenellales bacterium]|jgi:branched-chain amino acid transport system substrate-binding protein
MKRRTKSLITLALALLMLCSLVLAGCGNDAKPEKSESPSQQASQDGADKTEDPGTDTEEPDTTDGLNFEKNKLAVAVPMTGNLMQYGVSYKNAITMAVDEFNAAGGLDGEGKVLVEVEFHDDKSDQKEAINLASKIVEDPKVFAVIGSFGSAISMAAAPTYQDAGMPMISPNTSHPEFPGLGDMLLSLSPTSEIEMQESAKVMINDLGGGDAAILYYNTELGVSSKDIITQYYTEMGGNIVMTETFISGETKDFTPMLSKIKAENPNILYITADYNDEAAIMLQIKQIGMDDVKVICSGQALKREFLDIVKDDAEGLIIAGTSPALEESVISSGGVSQYVIDFVNNYNTLYTDAVADAFAGAAYDGAVLAMDAAKKVGTDDARTLIDEMLKADIEVVAGTDMYYVEGTNTVIKPSAVYIVENGEFKVFQSSAE